MNSMAEIIKRVELPGLLIRIKEIASDNKPQTFAVSIGVLLIYSLYLTIAVQSSLGTDITEQSYSERTYIAYISFSILLSSIIFFLSRNKLDSSSYKNLYYAINVKSHEFIIALYFILSVFYTLILSFTMLPLFIVGYIIFESFFVMFFLFILSIYTGTFLFLLVFTLWMVSNFFFRRFLFICLSYIAQILVVSGLVVSLFHNYSFQFESLEFLLAFLYISIGCCFLFILFYKHSTTYLLKQFQENSNSSIGLIDKPVSFDQMKSNYSINAKMESVYMFRSNVLAEQASLYIFLILITVIFYNALSYVNFTAVYTAILNFGLIEVIIILPLIFGFNFIKSQVYLFPLGFTKNEYLIPRLGLYTLINTLFILSFLIFIPLTLQIPSEFSFSFLPKVLFLTVISVLIGYEFPMTQMNKVLLILTLVITFGMFDFFLMYIFNSLAIVNSIYLVLTVISFICIRIFYLRKPVVI